MKRKREFSSAPTPRQAQVLEFVKAHQASQGMPPTRHQIAQHFGWASCNAAECHLQALEKKGFIRLQGIARGIFLGAMA